VNTTVKDLPELAKPLPSVHFTFAVHKLFFEIINPAGGTDVIQKSQSPIAL